MIANRAWFSRYHLQFQKFLSDNGITVNLNKSFLNPAAEVDYCGTLFNIIDKSIRLTHSKVFKLGVLLSILAAQPSSLIQRKIYGYLTFVAPMPQLPYSAITLPINQLLHVFMTALTDHQQFSIEHPYKQAQPKWYCDATPAIAAIIDSSLQHIWTY